MVSAGRGRRVGGRTLALALGITLPTVLLGAGWLAASVRERDSLGRERVALLARTADAVRGAVDESLEELRRREDARPFYLYNNVYSPPDVVALNDPIATSPLAADPEDGRVVGYFQVDPDGTVRTPYSTVPGGGGSPRGERVADLVDGPALAPLRGLAAGDEVALAQAEPPRPEPRSSLSSAIGWLTSRTTSAVDGSYGSSEPPRAPRRRRPTSGSPPPPPPAHPDAGAVPEELTPQGPLTVALNPWGNVVYNDLLEAQAGDPEASARVQQRRRSAPVTRRNTVDWDTMQQARPAESAPPQPEAAPAQAEPVAARAAAAPARQEPGARRADAAPRGEPESALAATARAGRRASAPRAGEAAPARGGPPAPEPSPALGPAPAQAEVEVDYTPMAWRASGDPVVLYRLVSHQGARVLQGVVLDRRQMVEEWIPSLVRHHAVSGVTPRVVEAAEAEGCALAQPASTVLDGVMLCYTGSALAGATAELRDDVPLQVSALAGLVLVVTLAGVFMHRAARRAEELSAQKSAFVSAVSHELRTPLTTIRMHAELLRDGLVPEERRERFHGQLVQEAVRLSRLVENVLELSRLEEGRRVVELREGDLVAFVAEVVEEHRALVAARGLELAGPSGGGEVVAAFDQQALSQIVVNLVDNAVKYAAGSSPPVVEVEVEQRGASALVRVLDHGPGIPPEERERVFERFHRVPGTAEAAPGTGIGLALVRELARAQGGDAEALGREGGGCEVRVTLPCARRPTGE